ncbi:hypothetical protein BO70DRAFT_400144 [Aspergillus heteromorphus CBS 117.55]|uniref:Uncharacterized protein n=1 Tax=Aspergillus heteromorphus CBS 117.55 TaxID=1448321 RepID=A0A317V7Q7_9EURO|nr:uncharacterized protein BO70DRAFT_400144 [Aspergillus heteromorphus CBS 117.55]PWY69078.1 hypothetical protein BO70DRAFT_400144 [Aspergillus heteromorphus CBS 117.55]
MSPLPFPYRLTPVDHVVARVLKEADIPAFLWGEPAVAVYGTTHKIKESSWVIDDDLLLPAIFALLDSGRFAQPEEAIPPQDLPPPATGEVIPPRAEWYMSFPPVMPGPVQVGLYRQSLIFWSFPKLDYNLIRQDFYMSATDEALGAMPAEDYQIDDKEYPVMVVRPAKYLEGTVLLMIRDFAGYATFSYWAQTVVRMVHQLLVKEARPQLTWDELEEPFHEYLRRVQNPEYGDRIECKDYRGFKMIHRLFYRLKRSGELPNGQGHRIECFNRELFLFRARRLENDFRPEWIDDPFPDRDPELLLGYYGLQALLAPWTFRDNPFIEVRGGWLWSPDIGNF